MTKHKNKIFNCEYMKNTKKLQLKGTADIPSRNCKILFIN